MTENDNDLLWITDINRLFQLGMDRDVPHPVEVLPEERHSGKSINLGHGSKVMPTGVRSIGLPEWDANTDRLPFDKESLSEIWALHFLEHVNDPVAVLLDCQRVLQPGGVMHIVVPYGSCHMAIQDITHQHFFNEDTWKTLFRNPYYHPAGIEVEWEFDIHFNMILGVKGQNLALFTQLIRQ